MSAFRGALAGHPATVLGACAVLAAYAAVAVALTCWRLHRGFPRSTRL